MSEDDIKFYSYGGSIVFRSPAPMRRVPLGAKWCEIVISTEGARKLLKQLSELLETRGERP